MKNLVPNLFDLLRYTIVDTSEGAVLLHLNSETGATDTGRIFVSDSEGYKRGTQAVVAWMVTGPLHRGIAGIARYSQSLLHNVRSSTGEVEFDKVVSLTGVYLANVVAQADSADAGYEKAKQAATESVEQVDRRHGRGWGKASRMAKEERTIRTVISFDKGGSWRYLKPPRVNSQGQPYFCAGKPLQDCALHLHGSSSWDLYAPFYSSENCVGIIMGTGNVGASLSPACEPPLSTMVKKKTDPVDGCAHSLAELEEKYKGKYKKKEIQYYWETECKPVTEDVAKAPPAAKAPAAPRLVRSRSWLKKVCGIPLLPCEESLAPLLEAFDTGEGAAKQAAQLELLRAHPFVDRKVKEVSPEALAPDVSVQVENFRLMVVQFRKWLKTSEGRPFEEKGKGFDDGVYLTSALLRKMLPRGFTNFCFTKVGESPVNVVLRGFLKFTGLTAADEDEDSKATEDAAAFLFHGYTMEDSQRFLVTTKSNGENGKYTFRRVYGDWYCFAGSKNTGHTWRLGSNVAQLFPIPELDVIAGVAPKIIAFVDRRLKSLEEKQRLELLEAVHQGGVTIMIELNDAGHEHIFPIEESWVDHVAILNDNGFPWPQQEAYDFFDRFTLRRVRIDAYDMEQLPKIMEEIRKDTSTEGAVLYLERDSKAIGLLKVKSDHYVIARRTRETLRSALVKPMSDAEASAALLPKVTKRLEEGMASLTHVAGWSADAWPKWAAHATAFADAWMKAFLQGDDMMRKALVIEFHNKFGSLYERFWRTHEVLPLTDFSLETAKKAPSCATVADMPTSPVSTCVSRIEKEPKASGKPRRRKR
ncbi:unnamed protein product [Cladocopium goreaui]|uniref:Vacuolar protein sorting/targeting protein 10 (Carboxypeptidase Y receptor) (CPY receptor) (Sortilin VPS10) (Vacuolar carboxypeptidase sorting receptor VPS10) n=1 Tax=Cladocopium goreaui TaxID=2562237 RepID=A0A9P1D211_9DINO|nr:unnamed protein product [Cladocopium goreaui]